MQSQDVEQLDAVVLFSAPRGPPAHKHVHINMPDSPKGFSVKIIDRMKWKPQ